MDSPFLLTIYDRSLRRQGWVGDYEQFTVTPRHNGLGTASLTVPADHSRMSALLADDARLTVEYEGSGERELLMSGPVLSAQGAFPTVSTSATFTVRDDKALFGEVLGWPVPGAAIGAQSAQAYDVRTGPAETVIKQLVQANMVNRLALPVTIAQNLARGATVTARARMDPLQDLLFPLADTAGIGISLLQQGGSLVLDVYLPKVHSRVLTEDSGVLVGGSWVKTRATATDAVLGGQGEGTARTFRLVRDTARAAAIGSRVEVFRDATDLTAAADLDARGARVLAEGAPGAGVSLQLAETGSWKYGKALRVGDRVPVQLANGVTVAAVVGSVVISHSRERGLEVSPRVGDDSATADPNTVLARALSRLATAVRGINTRR